MGNRSRKEEEEEGRQVGEERQKRETEMEERYMRLLLIRISKLKIYQRWAGNR